MVWLLQHYVCFIITVAALITLHYNEENVSPPLIVNGFTSSSSSASSSSTSFSAAARCCCSLKAAPSRLDENVDGVLYVNDRCINCAACSNFAPTIFKRSDKIASHIVYKQPTIITSSSSDNDDDNSDDNNNNNVRSLELDEARAALAACPVAAIRIETEAHRHHRGMTSLTDDEKILAKSLAISPKLNGLDIPFPRKCNFFTCSDSDNNEAVANDRDDDHYDNIWYVGYHNENSFGAIPYIASGRFRGKDVWIMIDTPKFNTNSIKAVTSLTGEDGPDYLFLTHVDDTADHNKWSKKFHNMKRIFHSGDLGRYNWLNDMSLETDIEILLSNSNNNNKEEDVKDDDGISSSIIKWNLNGDLLNGKEKEEKGEEDDEDTFEIWHTPGHTPGSISLLMKKKKNRDDNNGSGGDSGGVLFTGDTYAYTTRNNGMISGFPRYNKDGLERQISTLKKFVNSESIDEWNVIAPGHGHPKSYYTACISDQSDKKEEKTVNEMKQHDVKIAIQELRSYGR